MNTYFRIIVLTLLCFQISTAEGQKKNTEPAAIDESITYGKLDNGLSYYIKSIPDSNEKVNLQFYVKAGSFHQDPDQLNMAHFVEHMAFKSSENFPYGIHDEQEMWKRLNMSQFDIQGTYRASNTRYTFNAPPKNVDALESGLLWFKDIATGLHFKNEDIDSERGVLIQESIMRSGDNIQRTITEMHLQFELFPCRQNSANFIEHHQTFNPERLKQFYTDWYRPDLMAIVVVGNIENIGILEIQIQDHFSSIQPQENPREVPDCDALYFKQPTQFAVVETITDSVQINNKVQTDLYFRNPIFKTNVSNKNGFKQEMELRVLTEIINKRLRERNNVYNNFFSSNIRHSSQPNALLLTINSGNNNERRALQETFRILRQFHSYGALESEFREAVHKQLQSLNNRDLNQHRYWLEEIESHFVNGEPFPNNKLDTLKTWLSGYSLEEFHEFIQNFDFRMPDDIGILAPTGFDALSLTEKQFRSWIRAVGEDSISVYSPPSIPKSLMKPSEVRQLQEKNYEDRGIGESDAHELVLDNGVKVMLKSFKPSPGPKKNKIMLHGYNNMGALAFPSEDYFSAVNSPRFIKNSGIGKLNKFELQRFMTNNSLWWHGINLYVNNTEAGIKLDAELEDLEGMLQMVHLYFSEPRLDKAAFQDWKNRQKQLFHEQRTDSKQIDLRNNIRKVLGDNSKVSVGTERYLGLEKTDMSRGFEIYKELFGNAQDFTFILTGDFPVDSVVPLVNKYIGSLSVLKNSAETARIVKPFNPKPEGPVLVQFRTPDADDKNNYMYRPYYIVPAEGYVDWKTEIIAEALGKVLDFKVWGLRFEKGYSLYSVGAYSIFNESNQYHEFGVEFSCTPEEYSLLRDEFSSIITELKTGLISEELLGQGLKEMEIKYDPSGMAGSNQIIQDALYNHYRYGKVWTEKREIQTFIKQITPNDILQAARLYFKDEYLYEFVMMD